MKKRNLSSFILYACGFMLLWEWLRPVEELTDTSSIGAFIGFLVLSFLAAYLGLKWLWGGLLKIIYILTVINRLHYQEGFFHAHWFNVFVGNLNNDIQLLLERNWYDLSDEFRTLLFFILLWIMVYLIHYWLIKRQRIFIFFFMTITYITVLDTFTTYNAKWAMIRSVSVGFAVMGMLTYQRLKRNENIGGESWFARKWIVPLAGMITFSVLVGVIVPKAAPIWPDPVPYLTSTNSAADGNGNSTGPARIGYGTNDTHLGGPFIADDTVMFAYEADEKNYWKVETKDLYTGKGWLPSGSTPISFREGDLVPVYSIPNNVATINKTEHIWLNGAYRYTFMVYPFGIQKFRMTESANPDGNMFKIDTTTDKITFLNNVENPTVPAQYLVDYEIPKYKYSDLIQTSKEDPSVINLAFYKNYTRLPSNLPTRIKTLTEQITAGKMSWYEKAKAVESYFGNNGFTYDQKKVAFPKGNQDYVDQFLFDTKRGYCDNFSTSMAVMLRSIGIPTRWIKGYTGGETVQNGTKDSTKRAYQVTNNNAHAWVEVFFPNVGWVPFEPTKGFSNSLNIDYGKVNSTPGTNQQTPTPAPVKKPPQKNPLEEKDPQPVKAKKTVDINILWDKIKLFWSNHWGMAVLIAAVAAIVCAILYRIRGKWVPYLVLFRYRFKTKDENIEPAYMMLLNQLDRYGLKRQENQTLRNYARYIDTFFSTKEMSRLTQVYEQYLYHRALPEGTWDETHELWENLIKRTIA
jgi:hypothetical protein